MLIICNGGYRTGSTLAYNLIRILIENYAVGGGLGGRAEADLPLLIESYAETLDHAVVKIHKYVHRDNRSLAVYTYRNPLDVVASHKRLVATRGIEGRSDEEILEYLVSEMERYFCQKVSGHALLVRYEVLIQAPTTFLLNMARILSLWITKGEARNIAECFSVKRVEEMCRKIPKGSADSTTQLRPDHLSSSLGQPGAWRDILPRPLAKLIMQRCERWFNDVPEYQEDLHVLDV